jgi:DNA-binding CsgD family transcriptional regulator
VSQLLFPHPYGSDALIVWQVTGILAMLWLFVYNILLPFVGEVKKGRRIKAAIWDTYPGNMLAAVGIFSLSVIVDLADALILHYSIGFTRYSMVVFVLSLAVMLARLYGKETTRPALDPVVAVDSAEAREAIFREQSLTTRETEIARLMLAGLSNKEIAYRIFRSKATVDYHITNIYRKFGIDDKTSGRAAFMALFIKPYD